MKPFKSALFLFLAIAILCLPSCAQSPDCFKKDVFCVGLVTDTSGIKDHSLNQDAWNGLQKARAEGTATYAAYIETEDARDYSKNIARFAQDGYDVIITVGPVMRDETLQAADLYPVSVFIGIDQSHEEARPNLLSITFPEDQMGFMAGVLAARVTETGIVGAICETSGIDSMWRYCAGFRKGVIHADKSVKALVVYRDNGSSEKIFIDSAWGRANALDFVQRGADVIFSAGGGTAQGALAAAADEGVYAIGAEGDQAAILTGVQEALITSIYGDASFEVRKWTRLIREGKNAGGQAVGKIDYAPYHGVKQPIPGSLRSELDEVLQALSGGSLKTNVPASAP